MCMLNLCEITSGLLCLFCVDVCPHEPMFLNSYVTKYHRKISQSGAQYTHEVQLRVLLNNIFSFHNWSLHIVFVTIV